ncbi:repeat protein [Moumouvirus goulette]|uniref:Repeat protein n=1 Tax=Moumouvirus goulette TaxID=1247379 RepID=M1NMC5_9VIRU|nr:repeat protein [Moumouvirus goulette]AGF85190.1 repeat protein [Moumouvirus goulette]
MSLESNNLIDLCNSGNVQEIYDYFSREKILDDQIKNCIRNLSCKIVDKTRYEISNILRSCLKSNISDGEYIKLVEPNKLIDLCRQGLYDGLKNYFDTFDVTSKDLSCCILEILYSDNNNLSIIELILYHPNWSDSKKTLNQIFFYGSYVKNYIFLKVLFDIKPDLKITKKMLNHCIYDKNYDMVKFLLLQKIPNPTEFINDYHTIIECIFTNDKRFINLFIDLGVNFNRYTFVNHAICWDKEYFVQKYIELGYQIDYNDNPIICSLNCGSINVLHVLLKNEIGYDFEKIIEWVDKIQPDDEKNNKIISVLKNYGIIN